MKLYTYLLFLTALCNSLNASSQNLVLNPSFEEVNHCATKLQEFRNNVKHWSLPSNGSSDLFNNCGDGIDVQATTNYQGTQSPVTGNRYAGVYLLGYKDYREYVQGTLSRKLTKGQEYCFSMYISLADDSDMSIENLAVVFTDTIVTTYTEQFLTPNQIKKKSPQIQFIDLSSNKPIMDKEQWLHVTNTFIATENSKHFIIGNFLSNRDTRKKKLKLIPKIRKAYYYMDDVSVVATKPLAPELTKDIEIASNDYEVNTVYRLENVRFAFDSSQLERNTVHELDKLISHLKSNPMLHVTISGHTDSDGNDNYNMSLSSRRAQSVANYLIENNIQKGRVQFKGFGESQPITTNETETGRAQNRRVEFVLSVH